MRSDLVNKVLDAMEIMVKADQDNNNSGSTISATIIEQDSKDKTKYRIQVENEQRFATAMNGVYKKNDEVYVAYPESGEIGIIIGLKYREGANAVSLITEANYEKLTPNCIILEDESYLFNEDALQQALAPTQDGAAKATTILAKFKLNADLEINESIFYQVIFKIKFIEEDKTREFAFTIDDVHGNPYVQKSSEQFFEIKLPEGLTYSNFESIAIEGGITISDVEIYAAQKLDETGIPSARIYAVNGTTFEGKTWQATLKAEIRDEGLIQKLSETSCYWFKEDPLITKVDDPGYHSWGGLGWRLLNQTNNGEVSLMSDTLNISGNTVFRSSVKYKCTIVYNDQHYEADPIEIININPNLPKLTFYYSEDGESFLRASVTGTIPAGADVYFRVTAKDAFGKNIENFSKSKLLNAWGPIDRTAINGFNTYICDLILDFQEGFDEYVETQSIEVKELFRDFGRVVINGKKVYLYNEVGELEENIQPLSVKVYTDSTQTRELPHINGEGKLNYNINWILPDPEDSMIYGSDNGLNEEKLVPLVRNLYKYQYSTSNSIRVEIAYLDENEEKTGSETTSVEMLFAQQGQAGTNGTQYVCKIGVEEVGQNGMQHTIYPNALASNSKDESLPNLKVVLIRTTDGVLIDIEDKDKNIEKITLRVNEAGETIEETGWPSNYPFETSYVLKANITYNNLVYTAYLPVCYGNIDTNTGFYSVLYNSAGKNPKYRKSSFKDKEGNGLVIETANPNDFFLSDDDYVYMSPAESIKVDRERVVILSTRNDITFSIPILFYFNRYENAAINSWDGDKVKINNDENYILAAQGGFGNKDSGSFTGVVLGTRQVDNKVENGIFGYKNGSETFLLNAETGDAKFKGRVEATEGRIGDVDSPSGAYWEIDKKYIKSGNLYLIGAQGETVEKSSPIGQMLGLSNNENTTTVEDVCIRSGTESLATFAITRSGEIYATSGCIAGWKFNWDKENLSNNGLYYETNDEKGIGLWPYGNGENEDLVIHAGSNIAKMNNAPFRLTKNGRLYAYDVDIKGRISGSSFESKNFTIDSLGNMTVNQGQIGNWTLSKNLLASPYLIFRSSNSEPLIEVKSGLDEVSSSQEVTTELKEYPDSISMSIMKGSYKDTDSQDGQYLKNVILELFNIDFEKPIAQYDVTNQIKNEEENYFTWEEFAITVSYDPSQYPTYNYAMLTFNIVRSRQTVLSISPEGEIKNEQLTNLDNLYNKINDFGYKFGLASFYQTYKNNSAINYSGLGISNIEQSPCFFAAAEFQNGADGKFKVEWDGYTTITSGQLGGGDAYNFTIATIDNGEDTRIFSAVKDINYDENTIVWSHGISANHSGPVFWAGKSNEAGVNSNGDGANFRVDGNGDLWVYRINGQIQSLTELNMSSATETDSDIRLKNSITALSPSYEILFDNLQPVSYKYNNGTSNRTHIGFIAQPTLEAAINAGFTQEEFAPLCLVDKEKENEHWAIRYEEFIALNTDQIQKAKARITILETENFYLKARLEQLEEKVNQLIDY